MDSCLEYSLLSSTNSIGVTQSCDVFLRTVLGKCFACQPCHGQIEWRPAWCRSLLEDSPDLTVLVHNGSFSQIRLLRQVVQQLVLVVQLPAKALCQELQSPETAVEFREVRV